MEKKELDRELESVSDFFLTSGEEKIAPVTELRESKESSSDQTESDFEIKETVRKQGLWDLSQIQ